MSSSFFGGVMGDKNGSCPSSDSCPMNLDMCCYNCEFSFRYNNPIPYVRKKYWWADKHISDDRIKNLGYCIKYCTKNEILMKPCDDYYNNILGDKLFHKAE